ncbi:MULTISPECIES: TetR/AcrR family transcriptional regulator [Sphingobacterium]|uniref:TetR/AcrR family transcriptional regulator n=1 Tax=Sphingobacterium TaxID=28453 RepID=UPI00257981A6|nr:MULTISPECIES: TetR/AcrR family transcriptional regulator [Sphingobacterium]
MKAKQQRKTYKGEKNDKERTMGKLILSVGKVLEEKGYTGLTINNISKSAGVDRKLVYLYFGSLENLIETYIKGKDYWVAATIGAVEFFGNSPQTGSKGFLESLLLNQLMELQNNKEMQKIVSWQICESSEIVSHVAREREKMSAMFFAFADRELQGKEIDLRAIAGLLVAGINYVVLHAVNTKSTVCEIDLSTPEGMERIRVAVKKVLEWAYNSVEEPQQIHKP